MTLQPLYIKQIISLLLVIGGLFIALSNTPVFFVKPPVAVVAAIPAPISTGESTSSEQRIVTMSPPPEGKNWMWTMGIRSLGGLLLIVLLVTLF
jgi:hypothetical protein